MHVCDAAWKTEVVDESASHKCPWERHTAAPGGCNTNESEQMAGNLKSTTVDSPSVRAIDQKSVSRRAEALEQELCIVTSYLKLFEDVSANAGRPCDANGRAGMDIDAEAFGFAMGDLVQRLAAVRAGILQLAK